MPGGCGGYGVSSEALERVRRLKRYRELEKSYGKTKNVVVSVKIPATIYAAMCSLVESGVYSNMADLMRSAIRNEVSRWLELVREGRMYVH